MSSAVSIRSGYRLWRIAILVSCLAYAGLVCGSAADRLVLKHPDLAARIPALFASEALRNNGSRLLATGNVQGALALGETAVRQEPVDPASTALLGAARLAAGDRIGAERAFTVAGKLGWRVPLTQLYWMGRALEGGDFRVAALRLDALLRQKSGLLKDRRLLDPMESDPRGRAAMVGRMLLRPNWLKPYADNVYDISPQAIQYRALVLEELARRGLRVGCVRIASATSRLADTGAVGQASDLWRKHCPAAGSGLVSDGQFINANLVTVAGPFAWATAGDSDIGLALVPTAGGQRLMIVGAAPFDRVLLSQLLAVGPGRYVLSWNAETGNGTPTDKVRAAIGCARMTREWLPASFEAHSRRWSAPVTIGADCAGHWLNFGVSANAGSVWLEQVKLEPAR
jgi:hypothetical protein